MNKKILLLSIAFLLVIFGAKAQIFSEDFESGSDGWTFVDNDDDGYNWDVANASGLSPILGTGSLVSWSYIDNVGALTPDNLAISPSIELSSSLNNTFLKFTYITQPSYPAEKYSIYVTNSNSVSDIVNSTPVYTETVETGGTLVERVIDLSDHIGETVYITFRHYDCEDEYYLVLDNIILEELENDNAQLLSINTDETIASGDQEIKGTIKNTGAQDITSLEINWQVDSGTTYTDVIDGLNVGLNESYNFTHPNQWNATSGNHQLSLWVSEVNGTPIEENENSSLTKSIEVATGSTTKTPIFERFTSATCGPCAQFNNNSFTAFNEERQDDYVYIAYHMNYPGSGDPYYQPEAAVKHNYYEINGIPSLFLDGKEFTLSGTYAGITERLNDELDAEMASDAFFEFTTSNATIENNMVTLNLDILPYVNGEYNIYAAVIEKETTGNAVPTSNGGNGETEFPSVMMKMITNPNGELVNFTANSSFQDTFTADLSNTYIEEYSDLEVIAFIQNPSNKKIMQAITASTTLSSDNFTKENNITIFPNPSKNGYINIDLLQSGEAKIYDLSGRLVIKNVKLSSGTNRINTSNLSSGVYLVEINSNNKLLNQKIIIE
ncbi:MULTISPECIES: T9SS-dependent choice-of-anchor J family protein [Mesonia]|uniref:Hemagglutinin A n=1 Tax=Mesonia oceanica TaxID=2687242 RepID=A0AC61Y6N5_9FLAO|nr:MULTISPECIES: choice-of-anchor J domain-containing protein [Mesonia]MAN26085.1 hypothetical protein [Mesonia sp.]MAQ42218.1 hypothetical protein [Mesonia sp.]MBJ97914.1 hypothetical protein [Flavobacteriaceae bacterium]VVV00081.1 Hemagglutinin A [Mesonia oceanica]|tara:strand:- start:33951 stop:35780 length:1830 start_codon:yes stop_codon:yes gene_type:complete